MTRISTFVISYIIFAYANVVCDSLNYFTNYAITRSPRYVACNSCNREWADALLSSPWYPEEKFDEVQIDQEYLDTIERFKNNNNNYENEISSIPISTNYNSFNKYGYAFRRGDSKPRMSTSGSRNFYQRGDNSFENRESKKWLFDPYFTPKTSTASLKQEQTLNRYPLIPRFKSNDIGRSFNRDYQLSQQFSELNDRDIVNDNEYNQIDKLNRFNDKILFKKIKTILNKENTNDYKSLKNLPVVYRTDKDQQMFDDNNDDKMFIEKLYITDLFNESKIPKNNEKIVEFDLNVNPNSRFDENLWRDDIIEKKNSINKLLQNNNYMYNYYNYLKKLDVPNIVKDEFSTDGKEEIKSFGTLNRDKSLENIDNDKINKTKVSMKYGMFDDSDIIINEDEKLLDMLPETIFNVKEKNSTMEGSYFKFDPDFLDDIEYPTAELTEPTITDESTERAQ